MIFAGTKILAFLIKYCNGALVIISINIKHILRLVLNLIVIT